MSARDSLFSARIRPHVFGVCDGCGAVAWELLDGISPLCLGCAPWDYSRDDEDDYDEEDWEDDRG